MDSVVSIYSSGGDLKLQESLRERMKRFRMTDSSGADTKTHSSIGIQPKRAFGISLLYNASGLSIVGFSLVSLVFLSLGVGAFLLFQPTIAVAYTCFFLLVAAILIVGAIRLSKEAVRKADFYDDYFTLRLKDSLKTIHYKQIQSISLKHVPLMRVFPAVNLRTQIEITIEGEDNPLSIPGNPSRFPRGANLYSWLTGRASREK